MTTAALAAWVARTPRIRGKRALALAKDAMLERNQVGPARGKGVGRTDVGNGSHIRRQAMAVYARARDIRWLA